MHIFNKKSDLTAFLQTVSDGKKTIGFVPTMGALHQGHLSLLETAKKENTIVVTSIFVNPTQFNNTEDLEKYPRTLEKDVEKIATVSKEIIVYAPSVDDIYEGKTVSQHFDFDGLENQMEGKFRSGHFDGVGTIVKRLFEIIKPTNAYFGEKDFQQLQIVKKLVLKYKISVKIIGCPIYREANGLAMSSRNERLTAKERTEASFIYKTILEAKKQFGTKSAKKVTEWVKTLLRSKTSLNLNIFKLPMKQHYCLASEKTKIKTIEFSLLFLSTKSD